LLHKQARPKSSCTVLQVRPSAPSSAAARYLEIFFYNVRKHINSIANAIAD